MTEESNLKNKIKTKGKSPKHITEKREYTTKRNWKFIAGQLKNWSLKPDSYILEEFYTDLDIPSQVYYENAQTDADLKEAHEFALTRIGINREKLSIKRNESINNTNSWVLTHYFQRFRDELKFRNDLKKELDNESKNITINIPPYKNEE